MSNLIEYSNNPSKISVRFWQYHRDKPDNNITAFRSFKFKSRFINNADNAGVVNIKLGLPLKNLSNLK